VDRTRRRAPRGTRTIGDRYRLEARIGTGGSAEVWRARDERLDRPVAVKLLHAHLFPDGASRQRMAREARATARLAHPGIVPVHDVIEDSNAIAIVFQLVPGEAA
jgi:serine/threonine protein kinase